VVDLEIHVACDSAVAEGVPATTLADHKTGKPLVIVAEDVLGEALATLGVKNLSGPLRVAAVRAPGSGISKRKYCRALPPSLGGKAITEGPDIRLKNIQISDLGQAAKITIDKNCTVVRVKAASDRRIRMPLYANLSLPPETGTTRP